MKTFDSLSGFRKLRDNCKSEDFQGSNNDVLLGPDNVCIAHQICPEKLVLPAGATAICITNGFQPISIQYGNKEAMQLRPKCPFNPKGNCFEQITICIDKNIIDQFSDSPSSLYFDLNITYPPGPAGAAAIELIHEQLTS